MLFDLSDRTQMELTGTDRAKFLHGFCTNDIKALLPGLGCEALVCTIQGKVLGRIFVFCTPTSLWIDSEPQQEDALFAHLDRYLINEDVQILRRSAEMIDLYLHPAELREDWDVLRGHAARQLLTEPVFSHVTIPCGDSAIQLRHVDWLGDSGWLISIPRAERPRFAGEVSDIAIWHARRIAAGFPLFGVDITHDNLAQEVGRTDRCISFHKGCYLGQEPIARIDALGHVNRELRRFQSEGLPVPLAGTALLDPQTGTQVGVITSGAPSVESPEKIVALGYVRSKFCPAGSQVLISSPTGHRPATVV